MGFLQNSGLVIVADGSAGADKRLARVLWNDPRTGEMRHADDQIAKARAMEQQLKLPMTCEGSKVQPDPGLRRFARRSSS